MDSRRSRVLLQSIRLPQTSFIGRKQELKTLKELFETTRLLTLTGVGGRGKTRLAIELTAQLCHTFTDAVWMIEFASMQDECPLLPTLMKTLGIADSQSDSPDETVINILRPRHTLIVTDNCEHVILATERLVEILLSQCPQLKILATSREALSIPGEIAWLVPSLSLPPAGQVDDILKRGISSPIL